MFSSMTSPRSRPSAGADRDADPGRPSAPQMVMGRAAWALAACLVAAACSEITVETNQVAVELTMGTGTFGSGGGQAAQASRTATPGISQSVEVTVGGQTLQIDRVELVMRHIEVGRAGTSCGRAARNPSEDTDNCGEYVFTSVAVPVPLEVQDSLLASGGFAPGSYDRLTFGLNRLETDDPEDDILLDPRPDLANASVQIDGSFDGTAFDSLTVGPDSVITLPFQEISLDAGQTRRIRLRTNVASWFVQHGADGDSSLVDPTTLADSAALRDTVEHNIKTSFSVSSVQQ